jgi:hypothetical protein
VLEAARDSASGIKHLTPGTRSLEEVFLESIEESGRARS